MKTVLFLLCFFASRAFAQTTVNVTCSVSPCEIVHTLDVPFFNLDEAGGALIAAAIVAVWVVGWSFRMVIRALNTDGKSTSESES